MTVFLFILACIVVLLIGEGFVALAQRKKKQKKQKKLYYPPPDAFFDMAPLPAPPTNGRPSFKPSQAGDRNSPPKSTFTSEPSTSPGFDPFFIPAAFMAIDSTPTYESGTSSSHCDTSSSSSSSYDSSCSFDSSSSSCDSGGGGGGCD